jgi:predicted enzyme related to lactoylglutathione lyase
MANELGYLTISVGDVDRGKLFFGRLFGWDFAPNTASGRRTYAHITNTALPMGLYDDPAPGARLYFRVTNIDVAAALVRELGGQVGDIGESATGRHAECLDDQGTQFSLWEPAAGH